MSTKYDLDKLFLDGPDIFDDELGAEAKPKKPKRKRTDGPFYHCPEAWADRAAEVCGGYLILALRLHRRWQMRAPGTNSIAVTAYALGGPCHSRRGRQYIVAKLEEAGLIEVVERRAGCAPRVRVIEIPNTWTSTPR
jgi:hypothetical protein